MTVATCSKGIITRGKKLRPHIDITHCLAHELRFTRRQRLTLRRITRALSVRAWRGRPSPPCHAPELRTRRSLPAGAERPRPGEVETNEAKEANKRTLRTGAPGLILARMLLS